MIDFLLLGTGMVFGEAACGFARGLGQSLGQNTGDWISYQASNLIYPNTGSQIPQTVKEDSRYQEAMMAYLEKEIKLKEEFLVREHQESQKNSEFQKKSLDIQQDLVEQEFQFQEKTSKLQEQTLESQQKIEQNKLEFQEKALKIQQDFVEREFQFNQQAFQEQQKATQEDLRLKEESLKAQQQFSQELLQLLGEWQTQTNQTTLRKIQNDWDKDNWFSRLDRHETEQILGKTQHKLLILASQPEISLDCPDSLQNNLKNEIRNDLKRFLNNHFPAMDLICPVEFYGDYFKIPISDIDVKRLQSVLGTLPTVILYSDISDHKVNFHVGFWGLNSPKIAQFSFPAWNWENSYEKWLF